MARVTAQKIKKPYLGTALTIFDIFAAGDMEEDALEALAN